MVTQPPTPNSEEPFILGKNGEKVHFVYDTKPPHNVLFIDRTRKFSLDTALTLANMISSLEKKYGEPVAVKDDNAWHTHTMYWSAGASVAFKPDDSSGQSYVCQDNMRALDMHVVGGSLPSDLFHGRISNTAPKGLSNCGTFMKVTMTPLAENPSMVGQLDVALGDMPALIESNAYMFGILKNGADNNAKSEQQKGNQRKAPL